MAKYVEEQCLVFYVFLIANIYLCFQVKSYWLNSDGADVVFHMIDNFLL